MVLGNGLPAVPPTGPVALAMGRASRDGQHDLALDMPLRGALVGLARIGQGKGAVDHHAQGAVAQQSSGLFKLSTVRADLRRRYPP